MSTTGSSSSCAIGSISALQQKIETAVAEYPCNIVPDDGKPNFADNVHLGKPAQNFFVVGVVLLGYLQHFIFFFLKHTDLLPSFRPQFSNFF